MSQPQAGPDRTTSAALRGGMAVPVIYFGVQLLAAPFYPGYSFLARDAGTLGSPGSSMPAIFNAGSIIAGAVMVASAWEFGAPFAATWLSVVAVVCGAIGSINARFHPLPDPLHTSGILSSLGVGLFLLPVVAPIAVWRLDSARTIRRYLGFNLLLVAALIPIMGGLIQRWSIMADVEIPGLQSLLNNYQGFLQRLAAIAVFVPIGVTAAFLAGRLSDQARVASGPLA